MCSHRELVKLSMGSVICRNCHSKAGCEARSDSVKWGDEDVPVRHIEEQINTVVQRTSHYQKEEIYRRQQRAALIGRQARFLALVKNGFSMRAAGQELGLSLHIGYTWAKRDPAFKRQLEKNRNLTGGVSY